MIRMNDLLSAAPALYIDNINVVKAKAHRPSGAGLAMVGNCLERKPLTFS